MSCVILRLRHAPRAAAALFGIGSRNRWRAPYLSGGWGGGKPPLGFSLAFVAADLGNPPPRNLRLVAIVT